MSEQKLEDQEAAQDKDASIPRFFSFLWLGFATFVFTVDQITKWIITEGVIRPSLYGDKGYGFLEWYASSFDRLPYFRIEITDFFNIVMAWNTGVSFSMFSGYGGSMPIILICVALAITTLFLFWLFKAPNHLHALCYALVIGGALGNVIDRARFGAVIDFLDFHIAGYHWPAFNVADMSVVGGICLLIILSLFFDLDRKDRYRERDE